MGFFYKVHSLALAEDLPGIEEVFTNHKEFYTAADSGYDKVKICDLFSNYVHQ